VAKWGGVFLGGVFLFGWNFLDENVWIV